MRAFLSAFVSGLIAGLSSLLTALQGEHVGFSTITDGQWVTALIAFLIGTGVGHRVYQMTPTPPAEDTSPAEDTPRARPRRRATRRPARATSTSKPAQKPAPKPEGTPERTPAPEAEAAAGTGG